MPNELTRPADQPLTLAPQADFATALVEIVRDPERLNGLDTDKLTKLLELGERMKAERARMDFAAQMVAVQSEIGKIRCRGYNEHTKSDYAKLEDVLDASMPVLTRHGFSVSFSTEPTDRPEHERIVMLLRHANGHYERHMFDAPRDTKGPGGKVNKTDLHGVKSAITYAQRALMCLVLNLQVVPDDDGNRGAGVNRNNEPITDAQKADITRGMEEVGGDWDRFYSAYGIQGLDQLTQAEYRDAMARIEQKRSSKR